MASPLRVRVGLARRLAAVVLLVGLALPGEPAAAAPAAEELLNAIVEVRTEVPADARTAEGLGTEREGSGIVIDGNGLVLTIGYLILEASSAEIVVGGTRRVQADLVAYDHDTGFGLLRASRPLGVKPLALGDSDRLVRGRPVLIASHGGEGAAAGAYVVSRRDFAGSWEYLLENAIFTSPPHPQFGGAALLDERGELVGVGSLIVPDAAEENVRFPGNMFVPINALKPVLGDLIAQGRSSRPPRPWLGLYPQELQGRLFVARVAPEGPAAVAGLRPGDIVLAVAGRPVGTLIDFYHAVWRLGRAGVEVPLSVLHGDRPTDVKVRSIDRYTWLRRQPSY